MDERLRVTVQVNAEALLELQRKWVAEMMHAHLLECPICNYSPLDPCSIGRLLSLPIEGSR